jgi:hypothetical protein
MEGSTYKVLKKEVHDKLNTTTTILAELNSKGEAELRLVEEAKKNGGKFEEVDNGFYLVRKDNDNLIEEYKSTVKVIKPGWIASWVYSATNDVNLQLVSKYYIEDSNLQKKDDDPKSGSEGDSKDDSGDQSNDNQKSDEGKSISATDSKADSGDQPSDNQKLNEGKSIPGTNSKADSGDLINDNHKSDEGKSIPGTNSKADSGDQVNDNQKSDEKKNGQKNDDHNSDEKKISQESSDRKSEKKSNQDVLHIVISIEGNGTVTYGFNDHSSSIDMKPSSIEDLRKKLHSIYPKCTANDGKKLELVGTLFNKEIGAVSSTSKEEQLGRKLTGILSAQRAEDYIQWMQLCYALHNTSENLLDCFIDFSRKSSKYNYEKCLEAWFTKRNLNFTFEHLHQWAKKDNMSRYSTIVYGGI